MADTKNVNRDDGGETREQIAGDDIARVSQTSAKANQTPIADKKAAGQTTFDAAFKPEQKASDGRDSARSQTAKQLSLLGGVSATDRLLGLDLRPTMTGVLSAPPGNAEFLRNLSPQARRTVMRKLLNKQRERMRRLARYLRDRREQSEAETGGAETGESFLEFVGEPVALDRANRARAMSELEKAARMLNILEEMLVMQDYTISQIGTFTQG